MRFRHLSQPPKGRYHEGLAEVAQLRRGSRYKIWMKSVYCLTAVLLLAGVLYSVAGVFMSPSSSAQTPSTTTHQPPSVVSSIRAPNASRGAQFELQGDNKVLVRLGKQTWTLLLHQPHALLDLTQQGRVKSYQDLIGLLAQLYRAQHGREQPAGFHHWWDFAIQQQCMLDGYEQIDEDLGPFREKYKGVLPDDIKQHLLHLPSAVTLEVNKGVLSATPVPGLWSSQPIIDRWTAMLQRFVHLLPDMHIVVNALDYPRVWMERLSDELEAKLKGELLSVTAAYQQWGCRGTAELRDATKHFAMFVSPDLAQMKPERELLPVFSACKVPTCFFDIVAPTFWTLFRDPNTGQQDTSNAMCLGNLSLSAQVPAWEKKISKLVWRGTTTGGYARAGNPRLSKPRYLHMHRQRLVGAAKQLASPLLDAGFSNFTQCEQRACEAMEAQFGRVAPLTSAEIFSYKYLMVVGGNSFAERLPRYLCSNSLVFMTNVLGEWYHRWLQPYVHYVPVKQDYSDLLQQVQWAINHDKEAQKIVHNANQFVQRYIRAESIECYMYRLLLEYAAAVGTK